MSIVRRLTILLCVFATILFAAPALAGWGAGWGTGSVIGTGTVTGLKNAKQNGATVTATIGAYGAAVVNNQLATGGSIAGIVWCQNQGGNVAPGVNSVNFTVNFSGSQYIGGSQIDENGKANFGVHAEPSPALLNTVISAAAVCPNANWTVVDFIPQSFTGLLQGFDSTGALLTQSVYDCSISWSTLNSLGYRQQSPYTCTERVDQRVN
jgi:hypothetical protein